MSNIGTEDRTQRIVDEVSDIWKLPDRDDLLDDCINYVVKNYIHSYTIHLKECIRHLVIEFLSNKCADAMSEADLEDMARAEEETKISSYQEADQGL